MAAFSMRDHHFFPGFPQMAWPMLDWVLATRYADLRREPAVERTIVVHDAGESQLLPLMTELVDRFPRVKLFCLPSFMADGGRRLELGVRGRPRRTRRGVRAACAGVAAAGFPLEPAGRRRSAGRGDCAGPAAGTTTEAAFDEVVVGDAFTSTMTVTETHLVLGAGLIGDFNPHHVDETYARGARYGGRILHGMLTSAIMGAPLGMRFSGTAIGYLEHHMRFLAPVYPGDTLATTWKVIEKLAKPRHGGGVVVLHGECRNQDGAVVATAEAKMLAGNDATGRGSAG